MQKDNKLMSKRNSNKIIKSSASIKSNLEGSNRYSRKDRDEKRRLRETLEATQNSNYGNMVGVNRKGLSRQPLSKSVNTISYHQ